MSLLVSSPRVIFYTKSRGRRSNERNDADEAEKNEEEKAEEKREIKTFVHVTRIMVARIRDHVRTVPLLL